MVIPIEPALDASTMSRWLPDLTLASYEQRPNVATTSVWHRDSMEE